MSIPATPWVSVIIPCYKQAHLLAEAIESVLTQDFPSFEVIVVDDGSPDDVAGVVATFDNRVRSVRQTNMGLSSARNAGIKQAQGRWLLFLDADDYLLPGMLMAYAKVADANPTADILCGGHCKVSYVGEPLEEVPSPSCPPDVFHWLVTGNQWPVHAVIVRAEMLRRVGVFDTKLRSLEDWDLWLRLAYAGCRFTAVSVVKVAYRITPGSMSSVRNSMYENACMVVNKNLSKHSDCVICNKELVRMPLALRHYHIIRPAAMRIVDLWSRGRILTAAWLIARGLIINPKNGMGVNLIILSKMKKSLIKKFPGITVPDSP